MDGSDGGCTRLMSETSLVRSASKAAVSPADPCWATAIGKEGRRVKA